MYLLPVSILCLHAHTEQRQSPNQILPSLDPNSQQSDLMAMVCWLFSVMMKDLMQMTKRFPKQVMQAMTQTKTRRMMLARRFSKEEMPSVLGLQLRTCGEKLQYWNFLK